MRVTLEPDFSGWLPREEGRAELPAALLSALPARVSLTVARQQEPRLCAGEPQAHGSAASVS